MWKPGGRVWSRRGCRHQGGRAGGDCLCNGDRRGRLDEVSLVSSIQGMGNVGVIREMGLLEDAW